MGRLDSLWLLISAMDAAPLRGAHLHVVEWQKRGMKRAHMILTWLAPEGIEAADALRPTASCAPCKIPDSDADAVLYPMPSSLCRNVGGNLLLVPIILFVAIKEGLREVLWPFNG